MKKQAFFLAALFVASVSFGQAISSRDVPSSDFTATALYSNARAYRWNNGMDTAATQTVVESILRNAQAASKTGSYKFFWRGDALLNANGTTNSNFDELSRRGFKVNFLNKTLAEISWVPTLKPAFKP